MGENKCGCHGLADEQHRQQSKRCGGFLDRGMYLNSLMRNVPDFPVPGILFKDISPLLADVKALNMIVDAMVERFVGIGIDMVVGIESRGFIFGSVLALRLGAGFIPVRKPGKLPWNVHSVTYALEYGTGELQMHCDAVRQGANVLIVDDLLATGGSAAAASELVKKQDGVIAGYAFVVELTFLNGRQKLCDAPVLSLLQYGQGQ